MCRILMPKLKGTFIYFHVNQATVCLLTSHHIIIYNALFRSTSVRCFMFVSTCNKNLS